MTTAVLEKIYASMGGSRGFPALERTATSVIATLSGAKKASPEVIAHIIEDFALTQKLLKLANSSMYAPFAQGASSVTSAMEIVGSDALLHLVLGTSLVDDEGLQEEATLSKTLLACEFARCALAQRQEDVSIATFMVNLGSMLVEKFLPDEMQTVRKKMADGSAPLAAEMDVLGMTLQQIGVEVAKRWNLPGAIIASMNGTGDATLIQVAKFSNDAASLMHTRKFDELQKLVVNLDVPGVDKSKLGHLAEHKVQAAMASVRSVEDAATPLRMLEKLLAGVQGQSVNSVDELAASVLPEFCKLIQVSHCLLFMLTRSGEFAVRCGLGSGLDAIKSKLRISADLQPTAFHAAIRKNVDVSIEDVSKLKPASLPEGYRDLFPEARQFIVLPIAPSRVTGLMYFDWDAATPLGHVEMDAVKRLRDFFLPYLPR